jgi:hypothetical protein
MRYQFADVAIESSEPLPELATSDAPPDVGVCWHRHIPTTTARWFHAWPGPQASTWVRFGRVPHGFLIEFPDLARFSLAADGSAVDVEPLGETPAYTVRHLLLNQVLPVVLGRRGRLVLHASAIAIDDAVIAFVGRSGVGKSTLAAACCGAGARLVTDDALVLVEGGDTQIWTAVPSYASLRLSADISELLPWAAGPGERVAHYSDKARFGPEHGLVRFERASLPLTRVFVIEEAVGAGVIVEPLTGHRATLSLATHVFRLDIEDAGETIQVFDALARVVPMITVVRFCTNRPTEGALRVLPGLFGALR